MVFCWLSEDDKIVGNVIIGVILGGWRFEGRFAQGWRQVSRGRRSEVRDQRSEIRGMMTEDRGQTTDGSSY